MDEFQTNDMQCHHIRQGLLLWIGKITIEDSDFQPEPSKGGYLLKLNRVAVTLNGHYYHKFLFTRDSNRFVIDVVFPEITLGPIQFRASKGYPKFQKFECKMKPNFESPKLGSERVVFNMVGQYRVKEVIRKTNKAAKELFDSWTDMIGLKLRLTERSKMNFEMESSPIVIPAGKSKGNLRSYHYGISSNITDRQTMTANFTRIAKSDFAYHVHQNVFSEALGTLCREGLFFKNMSGPVHPSLTLDCVGKPRVSLENYWSRNMKATVNFTIELRNTTKSGTEVSQSNITLYTKLSNTMSNEFIYLLMDPISFEPLDPSTFQGQNQNIIFRHLSEVVKDEFEIILPSMRDAKFQVVYRAVTTDRIILTVDFLGFRGPDDGPYRA
ncbi:unnamed protein product, partial [Mesorhabditis spiculigera]